MSAKHDDDALSWAGDDDPTLVAGDVEDRTDGTAPARGTAAPGLSEGWTVAGTGAARTAEPTAEQARGSAATPRTVPQQAGDATQLAPPSSVALVGMGVLGGIYLLYTVGWFIGTSRVGNPLVDPVGQFMFSLGAWLAVVAPLVWFGAVYSLTRERARLRVLWLLIGAVLLAPLPFIFGVGTL